MRHDLAGASLRALMTRPIGWLLDRWAKDKEDEALPIGPRHLSRKRHKDGHQVGEPQPPRKQAPLIERLSVPPTVQRWGKRYPYRAVGRIMPAGRQRRMHASARDMGPYLATTSGTQIWWCFADASARDVFARRWDVMRTSDAPAARGAA